MPTSPRPRIDSADASPPIPRPQIPSIAVEREVKKKLRDEEARSLKKKAGEVAAAHTSNKPHDYHRVLLEVHSSVVDMINSIRLEIGTEEMKAPHLAASQNVNPPANLDGVATAAVQERHSRQLSDVLWYLDVIYQHQLE
eukprot:g10412.t1